MAHDQIHPEDIPEELRALFENGALPDIWEQALGDLSEAHLNILIEIQQNATSPEDVAAGLDANPALVAALGHSIAGSLRRGSPRRT
ncbi:MAG: hypothetical protein WKF67_11335 [Rubrobacteraceae bacterium]